MARTRSISCSGPDCAAPAAGWRRIFHWPLFVTLAAVHLTLLPLVLGEADDRLVAMLGGAFYLVLAGLDWARRPRSSAA